MALFTDGTISTIEDLTAHDSAVLDVAGTESIDLTNKLGLAQDEIGVDLMAHWPDAGCAPSQSQLGSVVVTTPLRLWHAFHTLALVYGDAQYRQLNDRYRAKRDEYRELSRWAAEKLFLIGVGLVSDPVPRADPPEVTLITGWLPEGTYYVTTTWVSQRGEEGAAASPVAVESPSGSTLVVRAPNPPANAAGWRVFAGVTPDALILQSSSLIGLDQPWSPSGALAANGVRPGNGQAPERLRPMPRMLWGR
jgi:hypothetical protein